MKKLHNWIFWTQLRNHYVRIENKMFIITRSKLNGKNVLIGELKTFRVYNNALYLRVFIFSYSFAIN